MNKRGSLDKSFLGSISWLLARFSPRTRPNKSTVNGPKAMILEGNHHVANYLLVVSIIFFLCCTSVWADEPSEPSAPVPDGDEVSQETVQEGIPREKIVWPKPFKPSEEIGADSQISFPTDI